MEGSVTVTSARKTENIGINGGMTVRQALAKFYNTTERDLARNLEGNQVRLNSGLVEGNAFDAPLRDRDVINIYAEQVARGGVKGAA